MRGQGTTELIEHLYIMEKATEWPIAVLSAQPLGPLNQGQVLGQKVFGPVASLATNGLFIRSPGTLYMLRVAAISVIHEGDTVIHSVVLVT